MLTGKELNQIAATLAAGLLSTRSAPATPAITVKTFYDCLEALQAEAGKRASTAPTGAGGPRPEGTKHEVQVLQGRGQGTGMGVRVLVFGHH